MSNRWQFGLKYKTQVVTYKILGGLTPFFMKSGALSVEVVA